MKNDPSLDSILHDIDHMKLEAIGVEQLANGAVPLISLITQAIRYHDVHVSQVVASLKLLHDLIESDTCPKCKEVSTRIATQLLEDYSKWEDNKEK